MEFKLSVHFYVVCLDEALCCCVRLFNLCSSKDGTKDITVTFTQSTFQLASFFSFIWTHFSKTHFTFTWVKNYSPLEWNISVFIIPVYISINGASKLTRCCEEKNNENEEHIIRSKYVIQFKYRKQFQTHRFMGVGRRFLTTVATNFPSFRCLT